MADLKEENVIFAMEEPEIAIAPHTQRRIATYLTTKTTQCFVTSHSPYIIETFDHKDVIVLRRDSNANVSGHNVLLGPNVKPKTYRRYIRRGFAEAMLGRGVVIAEGITEQFALQSVAQMLEDADSTKYPLDLSGVTIITPDGEGSIPEFGCFFSSLNIPCYAFYDKKNRSPKEVAAFNNACLKESCEIQYAGMEDLLIAEISIDIQWGYIDDMRDVVAPSILIPVNRPNDDAIRAHTRHILKDGKGWGRAAELLERCSISELPATIVNFLQKIYKDFPRPKAIEIEPVKDTSATND